MAEPLEGIIALVPPILATGVVLGTLGLMSQVVAPQGTSMKDYKIKSVQDMI